MIDFIRSFIDQISLEALKINLFFWIFIYIIKIIIEKYFHKSFIGKLISKLSNQFIGFTLFIITFLFFRYHIKTNFIEKYLSF